MWESLGSGETVMLDKRELDTRRGFGFLSLCFDNIIISITKHHHHKYFFSLVADMSFV